MRKLKYLVILLMTATLNVSANNVNDLHSPSGNFQFSITREDNKALYSISRCTSDIIQSAQLGFRLADGTLLGKNITNISASAITEGDVGWKPVYGERSEITDHYHARNYELKGTNDWSMSLEVRCYDEGVAFRYHLKPKDKTKQNIILHELTEFAFTADHITWGAHRAQDGYRKTRISRMKSTYERPQIFYDEKDQLYIALGEARTIDFPSMMLKTSLTNTVSAALVGPVTFSGDLSTPWRFIMAENNPDELLAHNDLILNLNAPCAIEDTSWIKPGKVLREVTLSTEGAIACIDFAATHGLQYILFDAGWYGNEYDSRSDATTVTVDPRRSKGELDLHKAIAYGKEHGIGIILYVNRRALERQLDEILPLYKSWGVAGVKFGFVQTGSQQWNSWLHEAVRKAAEHQLMVDIHDEYRPTGYSRTYPNLMTQEGIAGDETNPTPKKSLGILFPRLLAGAADNTFCYFDDRVKGNRNHAFQLAKTICIYSPWQFLFWYDRPAASPRHLGGAGSKYRRDGRKPSTDNRIISEVPELKFFTRLPTVWDDSKVLKGSIEEFAVIARRSGDDWYIGALNASQPRTFEIDLKFLNSDTTYQLRSYTHDATLPDRTKVKIANSTIKAGDKLTITLPANDGSAYCITPL